MKELSKSAGFSILLVLLAIAEPSAGADSACFGDAVDEIVQAIELPDIPDREFDILDFGAVKGGEQDARPAILAAIDKAASEGGGRVVVPQGLWLSEGPVVLQSRIELHLADGARLLFSEHAEHFLPVVLTRWEGTELYGYSPLIYARDVHDVAITGSGTIDGNPHSEFFAWHPIEKPDQLALRKMGVGGVPVEQRQFGAGHYLRPSLIQFVSAERVLLSGYTAENSPFWVNHLVYTDHATVRGVRVDSHRANNDGVDVDSSRYVLIEDSHFRTGDDAIVVKSGRDLDGRKIARPSEYVVVRNNDLGGEDGIALGSEMSGDIREIYFSDNILRTGTAAFRFKSNLDRGGVVEKIRLCNLEVESFDRLFWFQMDYPGDLGGNFPAVFRDIVFENISVAKAATVLEVHAPEEAPLRDVTFRNVEIAEADETFLLNNAENLSFENLRINGNRVDGHLSWK
ncbi:MAG: glycoside hydrolase family 28 protein [Gammaproteobacteria bacterium]